MVRSGQKPKAKLRLEYVHGFSCGNPLLENTHGNPLAFNRHGDVVYFTAAVGVVMRVKRVDDPVRTRCSLLFYSLKLNLSLNT